MSEHLFSLQPFPTDNPPTFQISGRIARVLQTLEITYVLSGDRSDIVIPPATGYPTRQHELWQSTCFEFFVGLTDSDRYWEFNLSPTGDWNVYRFEGYRQGMQEEPAFTSLPFTVTENPDIFSLSLTLNLQPFLAQYTTLVNSTGPLNPPTLGDFDSYSPLSGMPARAINWGAREAAIAPQLLDVGITTVIQHQNHEITYWALAHTGQEADFHRRDSFTIKV